MRKEYKGGAVRTTITANITNVATAFALASASGWPDGTVGPFVVKLRRLSDGYEEKILCASRSGINVTVTTRGYDGTLAASFSSGDIAEHVFDATSADQFSLFANAGGAMLNTAAFTLAAGGKLDSPAGAGWRAGVNADGSLPFIVAGNSASHTANLQEWRKFPGATASAAVTATGKLLAGDDGHGYQLDATAGFYRAGTGIQRIAGRLSTANGQQSATSIMSLRGGGDSFEWGHGNITGAYYGVLGAMSGGGSPWIGLQARHGTNSNTWRTDGATGVVLGVDGTGTLLFYNITNPSADNQAATEKVRFTNLGTVLTLDGAVGTPAWGFLNESNTGFYRNASQVVVLALAGLDWLVASRAGNYFAPGASFHNTTDLGLAGNRWNTVYAYASSFTTSDEALKPQIEDEDLGLEFVKNVRPVKFTLEGGQRWHYGFTAQNVKSALDTLGVKDAAFYSDPAVGAKGKKPTKAQFKPKYKPKSEFPGADEYKAHRATVKQESEAAYQQALTDYERELAAPKSLRYEQLISPAYKAIQELDEKIIQLEAELKELRNA